MATTSPSPLGQKEAAIPFWRDVRVLAIFGQVIFMMLVVAGISWLIINFITNARAQGLQLSFNFLNTTAAFDIGEGIEYESTDTFGRAIWVGIINTIRVSFFGIVLSTVLGTIAGIARLSNNWLVSKVAEVYVEIIRNIPLLVFLFFIHFGVTLKLPPVGESIQPLGWPLFLSQRGVSLPALTPSISFPIWLAFVVLAVILVMTLWTIQSRQEEKSGNPVNKTASAIWAFLIIAGVGWFVTSAFISDQAIMVAASRNIDGFDDFEAIYLLQLDEEALRETGLDRAALESLASAEAVADYKDELTAELRELQGEAGVEPATIEILQSRLRIIESAAIIVCAVDDSPAEINAASQLRQRGIPVRVRGSDDISEAVGDYGDGSCDLLAGTQASLAAERAILEAPGTHELVPVNISPLITNTPALAGFNIQGGMNLSPEFASLLFGLFIYHGAFAAELVRAGILSVSKGQTEAARALGLNEGQRLRLIVLPQAMRVIIPPMTSNYLSLAKNSSLAIAIGYPDLVAIGNTVINQSGLAVQIIIIFMVAYLTISLTISAFLNWYNKKVALVER